MREGESRWMRAALWTPGRSQPLQEGKKKRRFSIPHGTSDILPREARRTFLFHASKGTSTNNFLSCCYSKQHVQDKTAPAKNLWSCRCSSKPEDGLISVLSSPCLQLGGVQLWQRLSESTVPGCLHLPQSLQEAVCSLHHRISISILGLLHNMQFQQSSAQIHLKLLQKVN